MKLKSKKFNWLAGRPVVILDFETAKKLHVHVDERIALLSPKNPEKKVFAVVDLFSGLVKKNEIGLSKEVSEVLELKNKQPIEVEIPEISKAGALIRKKFSGEELSREEIKTLVKEIANNNLTEAEIAYFVSAEKMKGMSIKETAALVEYMVKTGNVLKFNKKIVADKHCVGGIAGNRTTPLVVSICAAAGLTIPKNSSRAITSAAGTADVIETISDVELTIKEIKDVVKKTNACLIWGGALGLAPSDAKILHVERILKLDIEPQLLASIMSKKLAAGSNHILIDIPYGKSAKSKSLKEAKKLSLKFKKLAKYFDVKIKTVFTTGNQPIGNGIGPVLEMLDVLKVLKEPNSEKTPQDLKEKSLFLASELMALCKIKNSKQKAEELLNSGEAYKKFKEIMNAQNSKDKDSKDFEKRIGKLKTAKYKKIITAKKSGEIKEISNKKINTLCRILGTPESISSGVFLHKHLGKINKKEKIITLYSESKQKLKDALKYFQNEEPLLIN